MTLASKSTILEYLEKHQGLNNFKEIATVLGKDERITFFHLSDLKSSGFLKSELRQVVAPVDGELGLAVAFFSLAKDFTERRTKIINAIEASQHVVRRRHGNGEKYKPDRNLARRMRAAVRGLAKTYKEETQKRARLKVKQACENICILTRIFSCI